MVTYIFAFHSHYYIFPRVTVLEYIKLEILHNKFYFYILYL